MFGVRGMGWYGGCTGGALVQWFEVVWFSLKNHGLFVFFFGFVQGKRLRFIRRIIGEAGELWRKSAIYFNNDYWLLLLTPSIAGEDEQTEKLETI